MSRLTKVDAGGEGIDTGLLLADIEDLKLTLCAQTLASQNGHAQNTIPKVGIRMTTINMESKENQNCGHTSLHHIFGRKRREKTGHASLSLFTR